MRNRGSKFLNFIALVPIILCFIWCLAFTVYSYADVNELNSSAWTVILEVCDALMDLEHVIRVMLIIQIPIMLGVFLFNIKRLGDYVSYFVLSIAGYIVYAVSVFHILVLFAASTPSI